MIRNSAVTRPAALNRKNRKAAKIRERNTDAWVKDRKATRAAVLAIQAARQGKPDSHPFTDSEMEITSKYINQCKA